MNAHEEIQQLENELDGLDIPALSADILVDSICATLGCDPLDMMQRMIANPEDDEIPVILRTLVAECIETSTQLPHILRALEIGTRILELDE